MLKLTYYSMQSRHENKLIKFLNMTYMILVKEHNFGIYGHFDSFEGGGGGVEVRVAQK